MRMSTFFIADDSQAKIMMLTALVKHAKIADEIVVAHTTEEAKKMINEHTFTYAFIDYEMPSENGPAVISYLREKQPNVFIALETSADSEEYERNARDAGATEFICTSYPADEVAAKVNDVLEKWRIESQSA